MRKTRDQAVEGEAKGGEGGERKVSRTRWALVGLVLGLVLATLVGSARDEGGVVDRLSGAVRSFTRGVRDASTSVRDRVLGARTSARNMKLEQQIGARLRGDKTLDAERIEVTVEDESTAVLKGLVADEDDKEKAVTLTRDTRGVLKVVDHLAVPPPPRVISARPAAGTDTKPSTDADADTDVREIAGRLRPLR